MHMLRAEYFIGKLIEDLTEASIKFEANKEETRELDKQGDENV